MNREQDLFIQLARQGKVIGLFFLLIFSLPLIGFFRSSQSLSELLEFPAVTPYVQHAGFSTLVFVAYVIFVATTLAPFVVHWLRSGGPAKTRDRAGGAYFPWWGYGGVVLSAAATFVAWTKIPVFSVIQPHTFLFLWLGYIITMNALCFRRTGSCSLFNRDARYLLLFPLSACFWWAYEYLNRFVQNWTYYNVEQFSALEYFFFASLSFSTILPAVAATKQWLASFSRNDSCFASFRAVDPARFRRMIQLLALVAAPVLALASLFPNALFPALWLSPLILLCAVQTSLGHGTIFDRIFEGDWREILQWALAALWCGFFWEFWNNWSYVKWIYHVPYVDTLRLFEMPLIGFAGYLPFGVLCGAVVAFIPKKQSEKSSVLPRLKTVPRHVAIIMDGNGRWAQKRFLPRIEGHRAGAKTVDTVVEEARRLGIKHLTLFVFSTENWQRPKDEVSYLMQLFEEQIAAQLDRLVQHGIRLRAIGELERLPLVLRESLRKSEEQTSCLRGMDLVLAVSYGGRDELLYSVRKIAEEVQAGQLDPKLIDSSDISRNLYCPDLPDPDLLIRTGNESRISNFLLWQSAYTEILISPLSWPAFSKEDFHRCLLEFAQRKRRFGLTEEQQCEAHCAGN